MITMIALYCILWAVLGLLIIYATSAECDDELKLCDCNQGRLPCTCKEIP